MAGTGQFFKNDLASSAESMGLRICGFSAQRTRALTRMASHQVKSRRAGVRALRYHLHQACSWVL